MEQSNIDFNRVQNENIGLSLNLRKADNIQIIKDSPPHNEPGLYHGLEFFLLQLLLFYLVYHIGMGLITKYF